MSLRHGLLGLLAERPGSGWDLLKRFESTLAFVWPATQSQLYTELNRMADDELVEVTATGARNRKEYAITAAGRDELRHWITDVTPERNRRNDAVLRVFFLWAVDPDEALAYLEREADGLQVLPRSARAGEDIDLVGPQRVRSLRPHRARERPPRPRRLRRLGPLGHRRTRADQATKASTRAALRLTVDAIVAPVPTPEPAVWDGL